jgi:transposase
LESVAGDNLTHHVLSVDEKTGIQALERIEGVAPESKGLHRRKESEYIRHGTTSLMAALEVGKGELASHRILPTRNEEDFLSFIQATVNKYPKQDEVILLADHLNTHMSASLVEWVARQIDFKGELGTKAYKGVLKSMKTRKAFLEDESHRIRFVYTPKHCSWLNPIENWFAKLQRHVIRNGNFLSVDALENKIENYISFYNRCLVKPLKWKFKGFIKAKELKNLNRKRISS